MTTWLRDKLRLRIGKDETVTIRPVYLDRIMVQCPDCGVGGMWAAPEGFTVAIGSHLRVICPNGHHWAISGIWAEEKEGEGHDD